jgi:hypothetical protein
MVRVLNVYQLARLKDDIEQVHRRIDIVVKEKPSGEDSKYFNDYIKQLKEDMNNLKKQQEELLEMKQNITIDLNSRFLIRTDLKSFSSNIKTAAPEQQHHMLKCYINEIVQDFISNSFKVSIKIHDPQKPDESNNILLEKSLYITVE